MTWWISGFRIVVEDNIHYFLGCCVENIDTQQPISLKIIAQTVTGLVAEVLEERRQLADTLTPSTVQQHHP